MPQKSWKIVTLVATAFSLDNVLLTVVVPIIPEFLYNMRYPRDEGLTYEDYQAQWDQHAMTTITTTIETNFIKGISRNSSSFGISGDMITIAPSTSTMKPPKTKQEELTDETVEVGVMFASKVFVQLLANLFVGPLTNRIGYSIPMYVWLVIMFLSTIIFAFGRSYGVLFLARALQGIGSSCLAVSGMGLLAEQFPDDKERGKAMGIALSGLAMGVLVGPPFGRVMYQLYGKTVPFLILAGDILLHGFFMFQFLPPTIVRREVEAPSLKALLIDPYIIVAAGAITFANTGIAMLEPSLPIHMMDTMNAPKWQLGAAFKPASISYIVGNNLLGPLGHRIGRWLAAMIGLLVIGICLLCIPLATNINHLCFATAGLGFATGMVDSSMFPELGRLVDVRHAPIHGSVYAIADFAFCLPIAIGTIPTGFLLKNIGFEWMLVGIAAVIFLYTPALLMLRAPPKKEELPEIMELN